jgi:hypothetical protein
MVRGRRGRVTCLRHVPSGDGREAVGESEGTAADGGGAVETPGADTPVR